jgi:hypothetical protein
MLVPRSAFTSRVVPTPKGRGEVQVTRSRIRHQSRAESLVSSPQTSAAGRGISKPARSRSGASAKKVSSTGWHLNQGPIARDYPRAGNRGRVSSVIGDVRPAMATENPDPECYRRRQRRRASIGWIGGLVAVAACVALVVGGSSDPHHRHAFRVPYGEVMTSRDYGEIQPGEEDATVLERLAASGRPERLVEPYVLILFPAAEDGVYCTYFEFSDQPQIFARLCFSRSTGELVQKLKNSVLRALPGQGQVA